MMDKKPTMLLILDGFGCSADKAGNGVAAAKKPHFDHYWETYCHGYLNASGLSVGLPKDQIGNSEVGHMNMGAGRVVRISPVSAKRWRRVHFTKIACSMMLCATLPKKVKPYI